MSGDQVLSVGSKGFVNLETLLKTAHKSGFVETIASIVNEGPTYLTSNFSGGFLIFLSLCNSRNGGEEEGQAPLHLGPRFARRPGRTPDP